MIRELCIGIDDLCRESGIATTIDLVLENFALKVGQSTLVWVLELFEA